MNSDGDSFRASIVPNQLLFYFYRCLIPYLGDYIPLYQCDQIGLFLKDLGDNFTCKNSPNILKLFGPFGKCHYLIVMFWLLFGQHLGKFWLLFIYSYGHTALYPPSWCNSSQILGRSQIWFVYRLHSVDNERLAHFISTDSFKVRYIYLNVV